MKDSTAIAINVASLFLIVGVVIFLTIPFLTPIYYKWAGGTSMVPEQYPGDFIILTKDYNIEKGDVIHYKYLDEDIIHKVVGIKRNSYRTKGINNKYKDQIKVSERWMVVGERVLVLPVSLKRLRK